MTIKPKHSVFDPFPEFTADELNYYSQRHRLLRSTLLLDFLSSAGQLVGKWSNYSAHWTKKAIPRISPCNLQDTNTTNQ